MQSAIVHFPGNIFEIDVYRFPGKPYGPFALRHSDEGIEEVKGNPLPQP